MTSVETKLSDVVWPALGMLSISGMAMYANPELASTIQTALVIGLGTVGIVFTLSIVGGASRLRSLLFSTLASVALVFGSLLVYTVFSPVAGSILITFLLTAIGAFALFAGYESRRAVHALAPVASQVVGEATTIFRHLEDDLHVGASSGKRFFSWLTADIRSEVAEHHAKTAEHLRAIQTSASHVDAQNKAHEKAGTDGIPPGINDTIILERVRAQIAQELRVFEVRLEHLGLDLMKGLELKYAEMTERLKREIRDERERARTHTSEPGSSTAGDRTNLGPDIPEPERTT